MGTINYDIASKTYDNTRNASSIIIDIFDATVGLDRDISILDFGCGTGNYLHEISARHKCRCFGVEPSEGMRLIARGKNPGAHIAEGNHGRIPFDDDFFDFIYMTDVIHHVPDLGVLFLTLGGKLRKNGLICIQTESHEEIGTRWYNRYFASLAENERKRYPGTGRIVAAAEGAGFALLKIDRLSGGTANRVTEEFVRMVEEKNYSMFRLLEEKEFREGLARMKEDLGRDIEGEEHTESLIWLVK